MKQLYALYVFLYSYKDYLSWYDDFLYKDNTVTVVRPFCFYNGNPYTGKTDLEWESLYW